MTPRTEWERAAARLQALIPNIRGREWREAECAGLPFDEYMHNTDADLESMAQEGDDE